MERTNSELNYMYVLDEEKYAKKFQFSNHEMWQNGIYGMLGDLITTVRVVKGAVTLYLEDVRNLLF